MDTPHSIPLVLLLGNHSSGKSSLLNHVLGQTIQTTGVAPTDDGFTIVASGPEDRNQDGPSLVGDVETWGLQGLKQFGPTLLHHTQLKVRKLENANFVMVDTPGMIDAPSSFEGMVSSREKRLDRGYDFTGVVHWWAQRADLVLLCFDPDKPGTTGESLSILLHALSGMDHKLLIILNKADQFTKIHDFARAYGSLCWNLSKVIPRKDLPRIYTMCLPTNNGPQDNVSGASSLSPGLKDLEAAREEVVAQIHQAPQRRLDNRLSTLEEGIAELHMHTRMVQALSTRYSKEWRRHWLGVAGPALAGTGILGLVGYFVPDQTAAIAGIGSSLLLGTAGGTWYARTSLEEFQQRLRETDYLGSVWKQVYGKELARGDEYTAAMWPRVRRGLELLEDIPQSPSTSEIDKLESLLRDDLPKLRQQVNSY